MLFRSDTGFSRNYARYPYGTYEEDGELYFGIENTDERLQLKAPGFGFSYKDNYKFYSDESLQDKEEIRDIFAGQEVVIRNANEGIFMEINGEEIVPIRTFWFAFAAFHPEVEIYQG